MSQKKCTKKTKKKKSCSSHAERERKIWKNGEREAAHTHRHVRRGLNLSLECCNDVVLLFSWPCAISFLPAIQPSPIQTIFPYTRSRSNGNKSKYHTNTTEVTWITNFILFLSSAVPKRCQCVWITTIFTIFSSLSEHVGRIFSIPTFFFTQSATCKIRLRNVFFLYWLIKTKIKLFAFVFVMEMAKHTKATKTAFCEIASAIFVLRRVNFFLRFVNVVTEKKKNFMSLSYLSPSFLSRFVYTHTRLSCIINAFFRRFSVRLMIIAQPETKQFFFSDENSIPPCHQKNK